MMLNTNKTYLEQGSSHENAATTRWQHGEEEFLPVEKFSRSTVRIDPDSSFDNALTNSQQLHRSFESPVPTPNTPISEDTIPIQIWEGTVLQVDNEADVMRVLLNAKMGQDPQHVANIELEWVPGQDKDLICPGAVFYLTLFKRTKRGSIENSQELRFRRRPSWSSTQLGQIKKESSELLAKMVALPFAE